MFSKEVMAMVTYSDLFQYVHIITKLLALVKGRGLSFLLRTLSVYAILALGFE